MTPDALKTFNELRSPLPKDRNCETCKHNNPADGSWFLNCKVLDDDGEVCLYPEDDDRPAANTAWEYNDA